MTLSRREALAAAGAALTIPAAGIGAAQAKAPMATTQAPAFYRYKVGDFEVTAINDGFFARPLENFVRNAKLEDVQKAMGAAFLPTDKVPIPFTTLAINTGSKLVLIDTGNGNSGAPTSGTWMNNFKAAGFSADQVDAVIISHFHGDHINGLRLKDGTAVFANAEIMVPSVEWKFWMDDANMNKAADAAKPGFVNARRVFDPIKANIKQFDWGKEVMPGIEAVQADGHTPGHTVFAINSGKGKLMAMSDTTNHPALFVRHPDWAAVFDMDADKAKTTRRKLLDRVAADKMHVAFYHAPFPANGHIVKAGNGYDLVPVAWSAAL
ncbi:MAG: MBL fold metallo-hydrolase [Beijerinckiaceae bacterium]